MKGEQASWPNFLEKKFTGISFSFTPAGNPIKRVSHSSGQLLSSRWAGRRVERKLYRTFQVFIARRYADKMTRTAISNQKACSYASIPRCG
jgi:hypothetical protein